MKKVLIMGGHPPMAEKIKALKFDQLNKRIFKIECAHLISECFDKRDVPFNVVLDTLLSNAKLNFRAQILVTFMTGKNYRKSYSFKTRIRMILFSQYKTVDFRTFKLVIRHMLRFKTLLHLVVFILGSLHFSRTFFLYILGIRVKEVKIFENLLEFIKPDILFLLDNGNNAIFFLLNIMKKRKNTKYVFVVYSWDNASTKLFIPNLFDFVGAWNRDQIDEIYEISNFKRDKMFVLGSKLADNSYSKYNSSYSDSISSNRKLLFIGMFNKFAEAEILLEINNFLETKNTYYSSITYRPHPLSSSSSKKIKIFELEKKGIIVNTSKDLDITDYDGIICLPTSMILEVIVARVPTIFFIPDDKRYRAHPCDLFNWHHFQNLNTLKYLTTSKNLESLLGFLEKGIPSSSYKIGNSFQNIFPKFELDYESRIVEFIDKIIGD
jgi:hypothetical protein